MLEYIQSPQFYQFFDNHPERVFVVILIACATIIALVAVAKRKPAIHNHYHHETKEMLVHNLLPGCYIVDDHRRLFSVPDPQKHFAPPKPSYDQKYIDEYFDQLLSGQREEERNENATPRPVNSRPKMKGSKRMRILRRDGFRCKLCGRSAQDDGVVLHIDHKMPLAKGGSNDDSNLWALCSECNEAKSDTVMDELFDTPDAAESVESDETK